MIGFVIAAFLLYLILGPHNSYYRLTDSMEPVTVQIEDHYFTIPKGYIWDKSAWVGGKRIGVNMHALLPDMEPYTREYKKKHKQSGWGHKVTILLKKRSEIFSKKRTLNLNKEKYIDKFPEQGPAGLILYQFVRTFF